jgi:hypothetical protein
MKVSGQFHAPATLLLAIKSLVPIRQVIRWVSEVVWMLWITENCLAPTMN